MKENIIRHAVRTENQNAGERLSQIEEMKNNRFSELKPYDIKELFSTISFWTDGRVLISVAPDKFKNSRKLKIRPYRNNISPELDFDYKNQKTNIISNTDGQTLQMFGFGPWIMLVVTNRQEKAERIYTRIEDEQAGYTNPSFQTRDAHDIYDGLYRNAKGENVYFGPNILYGQKSSGEDPGLFLSVPLVNEPYTDLIAYGGGRVSHGKPSSRLFERQRGGGGRGAIMGSMVWSVRPSLEGIDAKVVADEPYVSYMPSIGETETLAHMASPFGQEVPGQWAFASVRPVSRGMLARFPSNLLRLIRSEILARHGFRFNSSPEIQRFFNNKAWYHPLDKPTSLSPIETLNIQVIQAEETERNKER